MRPDPTIIREYFFYDPITGIVTRTKGYGRALAGQQLTPDHRASVFGDFISIADLAWCIYYGEWPPQGYIVDHKDTRHGNNKIDNLRLATPTQNQQNKAGYGAYPKGVTWRNRLEKPWQAKIRVNGNRIHLGSFADMEEAAQAYRDAAAQYHGEFANAS